MHFTSPFDEHEYALAVLRGDVPADPDLLPASSWPAIIAQLRAEGFDIRETDDGYALATAGHDTDGTGWSAPEFHPAVTVPDDLDLDLWTPPDHAAAAMADLVDRLDDRYALDSGRDHGTVDVDTPVILSSSRDESPLTGELRDVLDRLRGTATQAADQADAAMIRTATALRLRRPEPDRSGGYQHQAAPTADHDLGR